MRAARILDVPPEWLWPDIEKADGGIAGGEGADLFATYERSLDRAWSESYPLDSAG
jgi:hypothetical protein